VLPFASANNQTETIMTRELQMLLQWDAIAEHIAHKQGWTEETDWTEVTEMEIDAIPYNDDFIDGILCFADGCLEFHLQNEQDAYHHSTFPIEINEQVYEQILNLLTI
jgi:hypothetical protein